MAARRGVKLKDHTVLALDIGTRFIKAAEMRLTHGTVQLLNVAVGPTPENVVDHSNILDPIGLGRAVRSLLSSNKIRCRSVITAITGQTSVVVRPIDLPKMTRKELSETMKFEVERHIPFTVDEIVMDYAPIQDPEDIPDEDGTMKVLLAVAQEELINSYLKMISVAGLTPVALDVEILAAMRAMVDAYQDEGSYDKAVALVNIGAGSTDISIVDRGNLAFTRSVPIAGDSLTSAIADQLGRSFEEAEEIKREHGRVFLDILTADPYASEPAVAVEAAPAQPASMFDAFGTTGLPAGDMAAPAFSLEAEEDTASPAQIARELASPGTFQLDDDDVDDEVPAARWRGEEDDDDTQPSRAIFDLEADTTADSLLSFGTPATTPGPVVTPPTSPASAAQTAPPAAQPLFPDEDETPVMRFQTDDDVDDEVPPTLWLGEEDAQPTSAAPAMFSLDEDPYTQPPAPAVQPESTPAMAGAGPVFDLSSELEEQMPTPLSRPTFADMPEESHFQVPLSDPNPAPASPFSFAEEPSAAPTASEAMDAPGPLQLSAEDSTVFDVHAADVTTPAVDGPAAAFMPTDLLDQSPLFEHADMGQGGEVFERRVFECMLPTLGELVTEIRRSLEYYSSREPNTPIERVIVYGGTSRLPHLIAFIQQEIGLDAELANPLQALSLTATRLPEEYLQDLAPALPICIGLGLRDMIA